MRISDWSSDVCSSDLLGFLSTIHAILHSCAQATVARRLCAVKSQGGRNRPCGHVRGECRLTFDPEGFLADPAKRRSKTFPVLRSEEHTSELQSLMRISYAVFCLKKKKNTAIQ